MHDLHRNKRKCTAAPFKGPFTVHLQSICTWISWGSNKLIITTKNLKLFLTNHTWYNFIFIFFKEKSIYFTFTSVFNSIFKNRSRPWQRSCLLLIGGLPLTNCASILSQQKICDCHSSCNCVYPVEIAAAAAAPRTVPVCPQLKSNKLP